MEVSNVILRTGDLEAATRFWSEVVGLEVINTMPGFTFLDGGRLTIVLSAAEGQSRDDSKTEIVFTSDAVEEEFAELRQRGVPFEVDLRTITETEDKRLVGAHFRDPDGHYGSLTGWIPAARDS